MRNFFACASHGQCIYLYTCKSVTVMMANIKSFPDIFSNFAQRSVHAHAHVILF